VHRLRLAEGDSFAVPAAYVRLAAASVERLDQLYALVEDDDSRERYDYKAPSLTSGAKSSRTKLVLSLATPVSQFAQGDPHDGASIPRTPSRPSYSRQRVCAEASPPAGGYGDPGPSLPTSFGDERSRPGGQDGGVRRQARCGVRRRVRRWP
jgi:hypothetical protein